MGEQSDNIVAESSDTTIKVSFGVKRTVTKLIKPTTEVTAVHVDSDEERDLEEQARQAKRRRLEKFENGAALKEEDEEDKHMVIPLVVENDWRIAKLVEKQKAGVITEEETARLAILTDNGSTAVQIETTMKREVIQIGGETIGVAVDADYRSIPIEKFGLAILRGCGWTEGSGIGKQPKVVAPQVNAQRPKGLGLGATPRHPYDKKKTGNTKEDEETSGEITRNSLVKISSGRNSGKYGTVESRDDDNNSVYVRLALGGETVKVSLFAIQKVSKKEYERDAKCLNKREYDTAKTQIDKKRSKMEDAIRRKERGDDDDIAIIDSKEGTSRDTSEELWIRPDLVIRFINKDYDRGKLYKQKLQVVDVASRKDISIQDDYGQIYYNLNQNWMETVIPRVEGDRIMVVRGRYSGSPAIMERKDKKRDRVTARLLNRENKMVDLDFDDVCLYKPTYEDDYDM